MHKKNLSVMFRGPQCVSLWVWVCLSFSWFHSICLSPTILFSGFCVELGRFRKFITSGLTSVHFSRHTNNLISKWIFDESHVDAKHTQNSINSASFFRLCEVDSYIMNIIMSIFFVLFLVCVWMFWYLALSLFICLAFVISGADE